MLAVARPVVHAIIVRSYPAPRGEGFDEFSWVASDPDNGGRKTRWTQWVGDMEVRYTPAPLADDRLAMVAVLVGPTGAEQLLGEGALPLDRADEPTRPLPIEMDLAQPGEYELQLREAQREDGRFEIRANGEVYARLRFERV